MSGASNEPIVLGRVLLSYRQGREVRFVRSFDERHRVIEQAGAIEGDFLVVLPLMRFGYGRYKVLGISDACPKKAD